MQADPQWTVLLTTLSEYEFGFQLLQVTCRTIIVPVGGTLGSRGLWGPPGRLGYFTYPVYPYADQGNQREYAQKTSAETSVLRPKSQSWHTIVQISLAPQRPLGTEQRVRFGGFHNETYQGGGSSVYLFRENVKDQPWW